MFVLMKSGLGLYLGHLGSKTRSRGQIIEKPCVDNTGCSFHKIFMKFGQNVCLDINMGWGCIWVIMGQKLGHEVISKKNIV